jgi:hypothetical protein
VHAAGERERGYSPFFFDPEFLTASADRLKSGEPIGWVTAPGPGFAIWSPVSHGQDLSGIRAPPPYRSGRLEKIQVHLQPEACGFLPELDQEGRFGFLSPLLLLLLGFANDGCEPGGGEAVEEGLDKGHRLFL